MDFKNTPVKVLRNVLSEEDYLELKRICQLENEQLPETNWCSLYNRKSVHNPPYEIIKRLHEHFTPIVSQIAGVELKPSYTFMSLYGKDGYCPPHFDRIQCQYTLDIKVDSDGDWSIYIEGNEYVLKNNDAICFSGTSHHHYRDQMSLDMSFCHLVFFHFVAKDFEGELI